MNPTVSVVMPTYRHEKYISEAIEGVLNQHVHFSVELIITDDNSPDNTESIVKEIVTNHPNAGWINYTKHPINKGMMSNFIWALEQCKGTYIALCEGDDFWTDPCKLQKQVDFLELNAEYVMCYHPVDVLFLDGTKEKDFIVKGRISKSESNIYDLVTLGNYIHTPSVLFRNIIAHFPKTMYLSTIGDFFLYVLLAQYGNIKALDECMAVYRYGVGVHSTKTQKSNAIDFCDTLTLLSETVNDPTIAAILRNRANSHKHDLLPKSLRTMTDLSEINRANVLIQYVNGPELLKAVWRKFIQRIHFTF